MDFNKFKYDQARREREARKKRHVARLKEVKFKPHIEDHDYHVKLQHLKRFLARGDQVKVTMMFRGRELAHVELGRRVLDRLIVDLHTIGRTERTPILEGRFMTMVFLPDHAALKRVTRSQPVRQSAKAPDGPSGSPPTNPTRAPAPADGGVGAGFRPAGVRGGATPPSRGGSTG